MFASQCQGCCPEVGLVYVSNVSRHRPCSHHSTWHSQGSRSTMTHRGTCFPAPVSEKNLNVHLVPVPSLPLDQGVRAELVNHTGTFFPLRHTIWDWTGNATDSGNARKFCLPFSYNIRHCANLPRNVCFVPTTARVKDRPTL